MSDKPMGLRWRLAARLAVALFWIARHILPPFGVEGYAEYCEWMSACADLEMWTEKEAVR